jgi:cyclohexanone monooxygenase
MVDVRDVVVVGAGAAGIYMLHKLRGLGFDTVVLEAGEGVGGTWYWNRYPGARCDIQSIEYSFSFDESIQQDWDWSEMMAPQGEIESYLNFVVDRLELRDGIRLRTRVEGIRFDEDGR